MGCPTGFIAARKVTIFSFLDATHTQHKERMYPCSLAARGVPTINMVSR